MYSCRAPSFLSIDILHDLLWKFQNDAWALKGLWSGSHLKKKLSRKTQLAPFHLLHGLSLTLAYAFSMGTFWNIATYRLPLSKGNNILESPQMNAQQYTWVSFRSNGWRALKRVGNLEFNLIRASLVHANNCHRPITTTDQLVPFLPHTRLLK